MDQNDKVLTTLFIDTAAADPFLALVDVCPAGQSGNTVLVKIPRERCAELLPSLLRSLLNEAGAPLPIVPDLIVVCTGPGSWTGLRLGITATKVLAWTRQIPVIGISREMAESGPMEQEQPDLETRLAFLIAAAKERLQGRQYDDPFLLKPLYEKEPNIIISSRVQTDNIR
ncbi:MAG: hypothetical protein WC838_02830 [Candidatus Margulisiibacteriota bacterium]|jgi:hypothetical protein